MLLPVVTLLVFILVLMMSGSAYIVFTFGPGYLKQFDSAMAKVISDMAENMQKRSVVPSKQQQVQNVVEPTGVQKHNAIDGGVELAASMEDLFALYEMAQLKSNEGIVNSFKELEEAIKQNPKRVLNVDGEDSKPQTESQVVDWRNEFDGQRLTKNQSNPWSPLLNAHVREKFLPYFGDPRQFRLCYNATEHGFARYDFITRCREKRGYMFIVKTTKGRVFGSYTTIPLWGQRGTKGSGGTEICGRHWGEDCDDPFVAPFLFRIEPSDNTTLTKFYYPHYGQRELMEANKKNYIGHK